MISQRVLKALSDYPMLPEQHDKIRMALAKVVEAAERATKQIGIQPALLAIDDIEMTLIELERALKDVGV